MPHTSSAKKRLRQTEKRRDRNRAAKKAVKMQIKTFLAVVKAGAPEAIQVEYVKVVKRLDNAAAKRIIHPNLAARKKSRLSRFLKPAAAKA